MSVIKFPTAPLPDADAQVQADTWNGLLPAETKAIKYQWPTFVTFTLPTALEDAFNVADDTKKQAMIEICKQALQMAGDFNTNYTTLYNEAYP